MPADNLSPSTPPVGGQEPSLSLSPKAAAAQTISQPGIRRPRPGYVAPWKLRHRPVTSALSLDEHAALAAHAATEGKTPGQKATEILRAFINADDFEDATLVYGDGEA